MLRWLTAVKAYADIIHAVSSSEEAVEIRVLDLDDQQEEWHSVAHRVLTVLNAAFRDTTNIAVLAEMHIVDQTIIEDLRWHTADLDQDFKEAMSVVRKEEALLHTERKSRGQTT